MKGQADFGRPALLAFVLLFFLATHLYRITDPPNGWQRARETDTIAVARNFATESWNLFRPRVDARGTSDGVAGMEFPLYSWAVAAVSTLGWDLHGWARLLTALGGAAGLFGFHHFVRSFTGQRDLAGLATFVAASVPLTAFYGRQIQPDVWALAFATNALALFWRWMHGGPAMLGVAAAGLTAIAGAMQPTSLAVGLPMFVALWKSDGLGLLVRPRSWGFAAGCLLPAGLWFLYARSLNPDLGPFSWAARFDEGLPSIRDARFYGQLFGPWLLELAIGVPVVWLFGLGLTKWRRLPNSGVLVAWIIGAFGACLLVAPQLTATNEYVMLTAVFPLAVVTALGIRAGLASSRSWVPIFTVAVLVALPVYGFVHMSDRYGERYDLWAGRSRAALHLRADSLVATMEPTPCFLLYYCGRKGWWIGPDSDAAALERAAREGARYFLVGRGQPYDLEPFRELLGEELYSDDWVTAYELRRDGDGGRTG